MRSYFKSLFNTTEVLLNLYMANTTDKYTK
jgi:hypothetical protein